MVDFDSCPYKKSHELSDDQIDAIAERAAIRAVALAKDGFYKDVGRSVVSRATWLVGLLCVGVFGWLVKNGHIKL